MKDTMRAAIFEGEGKITYKDVPMPVIQAEDEVIMKVLGCSICGTDVHILAVPQEFDADTGIALGHELVGEVVAIGKDVKNVQVGDHAIVKPNIYCGSCYYCQNDMNNHCENMRSIGIHLSGGFAEYTKANEKVCYKIDKELDPNIAVFAEPLSCVLSGIKKIKPMPSKSAVLIGAGPIALIYLVMLKASGVKPIIVSEPNADRRNKAIEMGADYAFDPTTCDLIKEVHEIVPRGTDYAIDVVGSQLANAISCVRKRGTVLLFGLNNMAKPQLRQSEIVLNEINILGTYVDDATFNDTVDILEKGILDLEPLITHVLPLEDFEKGVELMKSGDGIEIIIKP